MQKAMMRKVMHHSEEIYLFVLIHKLTTHFTSEPLHGYRLRYFLELSNLVTGLLLLLILEKLFRACSPLEFFFWEKGSFKILWTGWKLAQNQMMRVAYERSYHDADWNYFEVKYICRWWFLLQFSLFNFFTTSPTAKSDHNSQVNKNVFLNGTRHHNCLLCRLLSAWLLLEKNTWMITEKSYGISTWFFHRKVMQSYCGPEDLNLGWLELCNLITFLVTN